MKTRSLILYVIPLLFSVTSCGSNEGPAKKEYFTLWNENVSTSLTTLKNFVNDVTDEKSKNFIPVEDRIATFDMDGTLIDSTGLWHEIDANFFKKRGMEIPNDYAQKIVHLGLKEAARFTKLEYGIKESEQEIMDEWHQMSLDMYRKDVQLKEGALELLEYLKNNNIPMAIATANDDQLYMPCIERLGIGKYFDFIADVNNVKEGKHSAKIYEYLADKMATSKENTLVIEDMPTCVKTAYTSGFVTVAVYDNASKAFDEEKRSNSDLFVNNLKELLNALK